MEAEEEQKILLRNVDLNVEAIRKLPTYKSLGMQITKIAFNFKSYWRT